MLRLKMRKKPDRYQARNTFFAADLIRSCPGKKFVLRIISDLDDTPHGNLPWQDIRYMSKKTLLLGVVYPLGGLCTWL